jgi:predicted  nucleic acid-binding Zn-ribbon protein
VKTDVIVATVAVLGFIMAVAGVIGSWRAAKNTGALNLYRETAQAWEGKARAQDSEMDDLREQVGRLETHVREKDQQLAEQAGRIQVLQDTLTGKASWDILEGKIGEALSLAAETRSEVRQMREAISQGQDKIIAAIGKAA